MQTSEFYLKHFMWLCWHVSSEPLSCYLSLSCQFSIIFWGVGELFYLVMCLLMITFFIQLASVDVDRIVREMDVKTLQDNIMHVTFSNIEAELVGIFVTAYSIIASSYIINAVPNSAVTLLINEYLVAQYYLITFIM